jgi:hypothetical protein
MMFLEMELILFHYCFPGSFMIDRQAEYKRLINQRP